MNFDTIRTQIKKYETAENASVVSAQLQTLISNHGFDIFKNNEVLSSEIQKLSLSKTIKAQLILVFSCSNISDYILNSKSDLNMVDVDNVVHSVVNTTGLTYKTSISLIADIFYACGLQFAIEYGPQLVNGTVEYRLHSIMPSTMADTEIKRANELYNSFQAKFKDGENANKDDTAMKNEANKAIGAINKLCSAGISDGFFLLARCYLYGDCNTEVDRKKAFQLMKISAEQGNANAAAALGDLYYQAEDPLERDYTIAHHYYTRPGSLAIGSKQQMALQDIYKQGSANRTTLLFSGIVFALTVAFLVFFHEGIFSGSSRMAIGVIATVLSLASVVLTVIYHIHNKFNGIRWLIAVQFFVWALYIFILVLA